MNLEAVLGPQHLATLFTLERVLGAEVLRGHVLLEVVPAEELEVAVLAHDLLLLVVSASMLSQFFPIKMLLFQIGFAISNYE